MSIVIEQWSSVIQIRNLQGCLFKEVVQHGRHFWFGWLYYKKNEDPFTSFSCLTSTVHKNGLVTKSPKLTVFCYWIRLVNCNDTVHIIILTVTGFYNSGNNIHWWTCLPLACPLPPSPYSECILQIKHIKVCFNTIQGPFLLKCLQGTGTKPMLDFIYSKTCSLLKAKTWQKISDLVKHLLFIQKNTPAANRLLSLLSLMSDTA